MKALVLLILLPISVFSQSLTLDDIFTLQSVNFEKASNYLEESGWQFYKSEKKEGGYTVTLWSLTSTNPYAILLYSSSESNQRVITYQPSGLEGFNRIKDGISSRGFSFAFSTTEGNVLETGYSSNNHLLTLKRQSGEDPTQNAYIITLTDRPIEFQPSTNANLELAMWEKPDFTSSIIARVPLKTKVYVVGQVGNNFYKVLVNGKTGYVSKQRLDK